MEYDESFKEYKNAFWINAISPYEAFDDVDAKRAIELAKR